MANEATQPTRHRMRDDLPPLPQNMTDLPIDERGYPVPWFVAWIDGKPDFRVIGPGKLARAVKEHRCWVCGGPRGSWDVFTIGPMCAVNRVSSEPPSHRRCATYSVQACPFLSRANMRRRTDNLPEGRKDPAGIGIDRNPGVILLWVTRSWETLQVENGVLFEVGEPEEIVAYTGGRIATLEETWASVESGIPFLREAAIGDSGHRVSDSLEHLDQQIKRARTTLEKHLEKPAAKKITNGESLYA